MSKIISASSYGVLCFLVATALCLPADTSLAASQQIFHVAPFNEIVPDACDSCPRTPAVTLISSGLSAEEFIASRQLRHELAQVFNADIGRTYLYMDTLVHAQKKSKRAIRHNVTEQLNALYVRSDPEERDKMRLVWTETLGFDLWYPYFKTKEIEDWFKERVSFKIFKMKCKPKNSKGKFLYVCKKTF